jgi:GTP-binding protein
MRREGFELCVGKPSIMFRKDENGNTIEPIENLRIDCPESYSGIVMEKLAKRKGQMVDISYEGDSWVTIHFEIPSRALIGYRDEFLTDTKGNGIMNASLKGWERHKGDIFSRFTGSLISDRAGVGIPYALFNLEPRGRLFIKPGDAVYEGMIVGEHNKDVDLNVNPTKTKKLSNMRASGKDEAVTLTPSSPVTLEQAIRFIKDDELIEVTPHNIRMLKGIMNAQQRKVFENRGFIPTYVN